MENSVDVVVTNHRLTEVINGIKVVNMPLELTPMMVGLTTMYPKVSENLELINFTDGLLLNQNQFGCYGTDLRAAAISLARHLNELDNFIERSNQPLYWNTRLMWLVMIGCTLTHEFRHALGFTHGESEVEYTKETVIMRDKLIKKYDITPSIWSNCYMSWEKALLEPSMLEEIRYEEDVFSLNILRQEKMLMKEVWALFDTPADTFTADSLKEGFRLMSPDMSSGTWQKPYEAELPMVTTYKRLLNMEIEMEKNKEKEVEIDTPLTNLIKEEEIMEEPQINEQPVISKPVVTQPVVPQFVLPQQPEPEYNDEEGIIDYGFMEEIPALDMYPFNMEDTSPEVPPEGVDLNEETVDMFEKKHTKNVYNMITNTGVNVAPVSQATQKLAVENLLRAMFKGILDVCGFENGKFKTPSNIVLVPELLADKWAPAGVTSYKTMNISNSSLPSIEINILAGNKKIRRQLIPQNPDKTNSYGSLTANAKKVRSGIGIANVYGNDPTNPEKDKIWFIANHDPKTGEVKLDFDPFKK